ncbi:hypothetical protein PIB30_071915 [Stylosanthes scabra]|uniref:Uncharacterized protein n=1 Tax=Stylosanthes scabra TaxID=79078 RepID=A0ABU6UNB8_9FABA|nr:hypothetical protein [Stylosanthes scabra]
MPNRTSYHGHPVSGCLPDFPRLAPVVGRLTLEWFIKLFDQLPPHAAIDKMTATFNWFTKNFMISFWPDVKSRLSAIAVSDINVRSDSTLFGDGLIVSAAFRTNEGYRENISPTEIMIL